VAISDFFVVMVVFLRDCDENEGQKSFLRQELIKQNIEK